jgi:replicative DNA helicase
MAGINRVEILENSKNLNGMEENKNNLFPSDMQAEQYLLGSILLNNEIFLAVEGFLSHEHFFHILHLKIYEAMRKLFNKSLPISLPTISSVLEDDKDFNLNNGKDYLLHISSIAITVISPKSYAEIVYDLALKRSLIAIGTNLIQSSRADVTKTALDHITEVENKLFQLVSTGFSRTEFENISKSISSVISVIDTLRTDPKHLTGLSSGLIDLDKKLSGFNKSDLVVIAGRPSMGKTALALNIALNIAQANYKVGFFSLEMSKDQLSFRLLSLDSGINSMHLREGRIKEEDYNSLRRKAERFLDINLFVDDTPALSIGSLNSRAKRLKGQQGVDIIFIDYLQLIRSNTRYDNRVLEISEITQGLKALAKELNVPVIALSQLSRAVEQRQDKRPILSDLRDSGTIEQDADVVMFIYREEYYLSRSIPDLGTKEYDNWQSKMDKIRNISELFIAKHRNGPIGTVHMYYDSNLAKFGNSDTNIVT